MRKTYRLWSGVLAGLIACVAATPRSAQGGVVYPTSGGDFGANYLVPGFYSTDFETFSPDDQQANSISLGGPTAFGFNISCTAENLWVIHGNLPSGQAMSTRYASDIGFDYNDIIITFTSGNVTAVGANFFLANQPGNQIAGSFDLTLSDGTLVPDLLSLAYPGAVPFVGFTTSGGTYITQLTLHPDPIGGEGGTPTWMALDNLYVGAAVPEPSTWFAAGFVGLIVVGRYGRNLFARLGMRH